MNNNSQITTPTINIDGKIIRPSVPKMGVWRKFLEFYEKDNVDLKTMRLSEYTDALINLVVIGFDNPEVTAEKVEEFIGLNDLRTLVLNIFRWLQQIFFLGIESIPNADEVAK